MSSGLSRVIDVNCLVGGYPYRHVPHPDPRVLVDVLQRERVRGAWVGHLPSAFHRDPAHGNTELYSLLAPHREWLHPVPICRPDFPQAERELDLAASHSAPAVRAYPQHWGLGPDAGAMVWLANECASRRLVLQLTVRFEDVRQRHPLDVANDLSAAHVRAIARGAPDARLLVCAAGREFIEEVHWGLTPAERERVWWDLSWVWGPPADDLSHLFRTLGSGRFCYGSMWPLRLVQLPRANLELLESDVSEWTLGDPTSWG